MKIDKKGTLRFFKYVSIGVSTFLLDLALLYAFVDLTGVNYLLATSISFFIGVTVNYILSRKFVFSKTETIHTKGYINFIAVTTIGITLTLCGMYVLVTILGFHYLLARCFISSLVGVGNYLYNLHFNFKVVGKH